ncbi:hypothetical protein [Desulforamulus hydrothermalis]|uniref:hypothetical protein n=1 Tax=Desulforamulus hydrothermalis TaxID=412895 RepID=UPI001160BA67|nr:hypothetical protein [Desulforamulus hydrothermalis]
MRVVYAPLLRTGSRMIRYGRQWNRRERARPGWAGTRVAGAIPPASSLIECSNRCFAKGLACDQKTPGKYSEPLSVI